jgi:hypothetical protein
MIAVQAVLDVPPEISIPLRQGRIKDVLPSLSMGRKENDTEATVRVTVLHLPFRDKGLWQITGAPQDVVKGFVRGIDLHPSILEGKLSGALHYPIIHVFR